MPTLSIMACLFVVSACSNSDDPVTAPAPRCSGEMDAGALSDGGADPDAGSDEDAGPEGVAKCEAFLSTYCDRVVECEPMPPTHADCIAEQRTVLDCGAVLCVTDAFSRCLSEVEAQTCTVWNASSSLPASCRGVLQLR